MKKILLLFLSIVFLVTGCVGQSTTQDTSKVLVKVNGRNVTQNALDERYNVVFGRYNVDTESEEAKAYVEQLKQQTLNSLIDEAILLEEADNRKIEVGEDEVNESLEEYRSNFSSEEDFQKYLKETLKMDEDSLKALIKNDLLITELYDQVTDAVKEGEISAAEYYEQNKAQFDQKEKIRATHVLVETKEEAEQIIKDINNGEDIAEIAKTKSIDPSAKMNAGDLSFFGRGDMVPEFEAAAFALEIGEITEEPVKTSYGYHVIKVTDKQEAHKFELAEVEGQITEQLLQEAKMKDFNKFIEDNKAEAKIEFLNEEK